MTTIHDILALYTRSNLSIFPLRIEKQGNYYCICDTHTPGKVLASGISDRAFAELIAHLPEIESYLRKLVQAYGRATHLR